MDTMPKKMPALTGIKKPELIAMFKQLWSSAYKLSQAIEGHHANAEGLRIWLGNCVAITVYKVVAQP